jgi:hypothetical protein
VILVGNDAFTPGDCHGSNSSILSKKYSRGSANDRFSYKLNLNSDEIKCGSGICYVSDVTVVPHVSISGSR